MWDHNNITRFKEPTSSLVTAYTSLSGSKLPLQALLSRLCCSRIPPFFGSKPPLRVLEPQKVRHSGAKASLRREAWPPLTKWTKASTLGMTKYQVEKNRLCNDPAYVFKWHFFNPLDSFISKQHHTNTPLPPNAVARHLLTLARAPALTSPQELTSDSMVMTEQKWVTAVTTARRVLPPMRYAIPVRVGVAKDDSNSDINMEMWQSSGGKRNANVKLKGNVNGRRRVEKKVRDECRQLAEAIG
ncbi:hypothetical protein Tco_1213009 [Tanacetum coccineum]